jgi:hypothetical protein
MTIVSAVWSKWWRCAWRELRYGWHLRQTREIARRHSCWQILKEVMLILDPTAAAAAAAAASPSLLLLLVL